MPPLFNNDGKLIPGIHTMKWSDFYNDYSYNMRRKKLLQGLIKAIAELKRASVGEIFIDGSFVTTKNEPNDYDACWNIIGADLNVLDSVFRDFSNGRIAQKIKYGGEFFPHDMIEGYSGLTFLEFFQYDKNTGKAKGIVRIDLRDVI